MHEGSSGLPETASEGSLDCVGDLLILPGSQSQHRHLGPAVQGECGICRELIHSVDELLATLLCQGVVPHIIHRPAEAPRVSPELS